MKEIGGYFQLEEMPGEEYYPDLYRVNLGRTALLWLLKSRRCRKILLPYFLCGSVVHTCQENQIETEFYHLNEKLEVLYPKEQLPEGEYLYLVNYYGQLSDSRISEYKKIYGNIIVDHTHAEAVSVGDIVDVRVIGVDMKKKRISLSMKGLNK